MPKDIDSPRSASTKRRNKATDQGKGKEPEIINDFDTGSDLANGARSPNTGMASSRDAFQRLANIVHFMSSGPNLNDIATIERDYGGEIDRVKEIEELNRAIAKMTYARSEEMENLRRDNVKLKEREDECQLEQQKCKTMREEMNAKEAAADAKREQEYEEKVKENELKKKEYMDTKRDEMEADFNERTRSLKERSKKLLTEKEKLKQQVADLETKAKEMETRHRHEMLGFQSEHQEVELELRQLKSEFSVEEQPLQFYSQRFLEISTDVKNLSIKYFLVLPERTPLELETLQQTLNKHTSMFDSILLLSTDASNFVRSQIARSIISTCLCNQIWQPFLTEGSSTDHQVLNRFLDALSKTLLASRGRGESAWRVLTLQAIDALPKPLVDSPKTKSILDQILGTLGPLIAGGDQAQFQDELTDIIKKSISTWEIARSDKNRFIIEMHPNVFDKERWYAEDIQVLEKTSSSGERPAATTENPICLFPNVLHMTSGGESVVIRQGCALFPSSYAWNQAILEKKDNEMELEEAMQEARSKVHARRTSLPNGPNSPTRGKLSALAAANFQKYALD